MRIKNLAKTKRRYHTILADPPWSYYGNREKTSDQELNMWRRKLPYGSMSTDAICDLPVSRIAEKDAILFLWTTNAHIEDALEVILAWEFDYKTMRTWGKSHFGQGYWLRGQTEHLLLATRGSPTGGRKKTASAIKGHNISTLLLAPAGKHSAKPRESYEAVRRLGRTPRIELFARRRRDGFDRWGKQAPDDRGLAESERDIAQYL